MSRADVTPMRRFLRWSLWGATGAVVLAYATVVAYLMGLGDLLKPLVEPFTDTQYVIDEAMVAFLGVVLLALGALGKRRETV